MDRLPLFTQYRPTSVTMVTPTSGSLVAAGSIGIVVLAGKTIKNVNNFLIFHKSYKNVGVLF